MTIRPALLLHLEPAPYILLSDERILPRLAHHRVGVDIEHLRDVAGIRWPEQQCRSRHALT
jgi:hypothetical protein